MAHSQFLNERTRRFLREFEILEHDDELRADVETIEMLTNTQARALLERVITERIQEYERFHEHYPYTVPRLQPSNGFVLGKTMSNEQAIIPRESHVIAAGPTGVGKTTVFAGMLAQMPDDTHQLVLDQKNDTEHLLRQERFLSLNHLAFSPIALPHYTSMGSFITSIASLYSDSFWAMHVQQAVITRTLEAVYARTSSPSLAEWQEELRRTKGEPARLIAERLETIRITHEAIFHSKQSIWEWIHDTSVHYGINGPLAPPHRFLFWLLVEQRWMALRARNHRDHVHTYVLVDEGDISFRRQATPGDVPGVPLQLLPRTREAGVYFLIGSPTWNLHELVIANTPVQIALQAAPADMQYLRTAWNLNHEQVQFATTMPRGQAIVKMRDHRPFLVNTTNTNVNKVLTMEERTTAIERSKRKTESSTIIPARSPEKNPPKQPATTEGNSPTVMLTRGEALLLPVIADEGVTPSTPAYTKATLPLADGDKAAKSLAEKGLIERERVVLHAGRGGHGVALCATPSGLERCGKERATRTRGGDTLQHRWLIQELQKLVPTSTIEGMVGTKSVDLLIPIDHAKHQKLIGLITKSTKKTPDTVKQGSLFAIEVETSAPTKTSANNITKNTSAGIALTITATLPRDVTPTKAHLGKTLGNDHADKYAVMNVLELLKDLKGGAP